jgi:ketosteroid isomerase-like protein
MSLGRRVVSIATVLTALSGTAHAQAAAEFQKILDAYSKALDANDVDTLVGLYTPNGVFMREDMPAVVGRDALRASYKNVFATLKVSLGFKVQEAEQSGDLGWARSVSTGKVKVLASGAETQDSYNQLVVFRKDGGTWKIRSYLYASSK